MASTNHDLIMDVFFATLFKYGIPALIVVVIVSLIGIKLKNRARQKRRKNHNRRAWRKD